MIPFREVLMQHQIFEAELAGAEAILKGAGRNTKGFREQVIQYAKEHHVTSARAVDIILTKWGNESRGLQNTHICGDPNSPCDMSCYPKPTWFVTVTDVPEGNVLLKEVKLTREKMLELVAKYTEEPGGAVLFEMGMD